MQNKIASKKKKNYFRAKIDFSMLVEMGCGDGDVSIGFWGLGSENKRKFEKEMTRCWHDVMVIVVTLEMSCGDSHVKIGFQGFEEREKVRYQKTMRRVRKFKFVRVKIILHYLLFEPM